MLKRLRNKRFAGLLLGAKFVFDILDTIVGKVGYLGLFTAPEDFQTALERFPRWFGVTVAEIVAWAHWFWEFATSSKAYWVVLPAVLVVLLWDERPVWRVRHSFGYGWRRRLVDQVWISDVDAIKVMRESDWGKMKEPRVTRSVDMFSKLFQSTTVVDSGLSEDQKKILKFKAYLRMTLEGFISDNARSVRIEEGKREIEENALRLFLRAIMRDSVIEEFGDIPRKRV